MGKVIDWLKQEKELDMKINVLQDIINDLEYQRDEITFQRIRYQTEHNEMTKRG
jgi:hypothetical protein